MASSPTRLSLDVEHRFRICTGTGKLCAPTKAHALDVAEAMMERGDVKPGCHITPYPCEVCGEWHVCNRVIVVVP